MVVLDQLPPKFEGFTILQLSDLHGKQFGDGQRLLLDVIDGLSYDVVAITGDMSDGYQASPDDEAFFALVEGLPPEKDVFYVEGNTGPWAVEWVYPGLADGKLTEVGQRMDDAGIQTLLEPVAIERGDARLWIELGYEPFINQQLSGQMSSQHEKQDLETARAYGRSLLARLSELPESEVLIGITHVPFSVAEATDMPENRPAYDLLIAGHYHGGQIRIPFLDASASIALLRFRLFNRPEVNLIGLTSGPRRNPRKNRFRPWMLQRQVSTDRATSAGIAPTLSAGLDLIGLDRRQQSRVAVRENLLDLYIVAQISASLRFLSTHEVP